MKKKPKPKAKPKSQPQSKPSTQFMASDAAVEKGETGYDNEGQFGIGMIKTGGNK